MQIGKNIGSRLVAIFMIAMLMAGYASIPVLADQSDRSKVKYFSDTVNGAWYNNAVIYCSGRKYMTGYNDVTFRPSNTVTRAEMATIMSSMLKLSGKASNTFIDVPNGKWYTTPILNCVKAGVMSGYNKEKFGPNDTLTREQGAVILAKAFNVGKTSGRTSFADDSKISSWAVGQVKAMTSKRMLSGMGNNLFLPKATMTRAQVCQIIYAASDTKKLIDTIKKQPQEDWVETYINVINEYRFVHGTDSIESVSLIFVDNDSIPELIIDGISSALGAQASTYYRGNVSSTDLDLHVLQYEEKGNVLMNSVSSMGIGREYFYSIENGQWVKSDYGNIRYKDGQGYGNPPATVWTWNGKEVSEDEYESAVKAVIDVDVAIAEDNRYSYSEMLEILKGASSEDDSSSYQFDVEKAKKQIINYYTDNTTVKYEKDIRYIAVDEEKDSGNTYTMKLIMYWYPEEEARRIAESMSGGGRLLTVVTIDKASGKVTDSFDNSPEWYLK